MAKEILSLDSLYHTEAEYDGKITTCIRFLTPHRGEIRWQNNYLHQITFNSNGNQRSKNGTRVFLPPILMQRNIMWVGNASNKYESGFTATRIIPNTTSVMTTFLLVSERKTMTKKPNNYSLSTEIWSSATLPVLHWPWTS